MTPDGSSEGAAVGAVVVPRKQRKKPHHKSRGGCFNCKRRKVKCDEARPQCADCSRFCLLCSYASDDIGPDSPSRTDSPGQPEINDLAQQLRRGRGRPRRDWAAEQITHHNRTQATNTQPSSTRAIPDLTIHIDQAELLQQFITCTGPGLAGSEDPSHPIVRFWGRHATQIGFSHHYVLHLSLSLSAYHLAYLAARDRHDVRSCYLTLADQHLSIGLVKANEALSTISPTTCGAVYMSTMLICYCIFAAGPMGSDDLLVCGLGTTAPNRWLPLARGARLLQELYDSDILFTGLTGPLGPNSGLTEDPRPTCDCKSFPRIDWIGPVEKLRGLIASHEAQKRDVCLRAFDILAAVYEATFGDKDGRVGCPLRHKMVLIWFYTMEDEFVICLQEMDNLAMLLLGYYAPLLKTMEDGWFMEGWAKHILTTLQARVRGSHVDLLKWPIEVVGELT